MLYIYIYIYIYIYGDKSKHQCSTLVVLKQWVVTSEELTSNNLEGHGVPYK
jgi:hypothetical protein